MKVNIVFYSLSLFLILVTNFIIKPFHLFKSDDFNNNMVYKQIPNADDLFEVRWYNNSFKQVAIPPRVIHNLVIVPDEIKLINGITSKPYWFAAREDSIPYSIFAKENNLGRYVIVDLGDRIDIKDMYSNESSWKKKVFTKQNISFVSNKKDTLLIFREKFDIIAAYRFYKVIWKYKTDGKSYCQPVIYKSSVYFTDDKNLYCLDTLGKETWRVPFGNIESNIKIIDNILYSFVNGKGLCAFELTEKKMKWMMKWSDHCRKILIKNDTIFFASGKLHAINKENGNIIWQNESDYFLPDYITLFKGYVIAYTSDGVTGTINVLDVKKGIVRYKDWATKRFMVRRATDESREYSNTKAIHLFADELVDNRLLIGFADNILYAFEEKKK